MKSLKTALVVLALCLSAAAQADEPVGANAARAVIQSQLDAFRAESANDAYQFAAPNIRRIFPTADVFGRMVKNGYPMVWNPSKTEFLTAEPRGKMIVQRLRIVDQNGRPYIAEYAMILVDGVWRIAGVEIVEDTSYGA